MRVLFLVIFLVGLALGVGYPFVVENAPRREIGSWPAYDRASGFQKVEATLTENDAPVRVLVDLVSSGVPRFSSDRIALTVTADHGSRTVLAKALNFAEALPHSDSPQSTQRMFRDEAGVIPEVEDGAYLFTVGPGDADDLGLVSARVVLQSGGLAYDDRVQPIGFMLMAVGFVGFVIALRRGGGGRPQNPNSQPPPPRWGRNAGNQS